MSAGTYLLGALLTAAIAFSLGAGAAATRARLLPDGGALATIVLAVGELVIIAELLGVFGLMRRAPLTVACLALGLAQLSLGMRAHVSPRRTRATPSGAALPGVALPRVALSGGAAALVALEWGVRSTQRLAGGMADPDTLWYHMPFAAGFAQSGFTTRLHFTQSEPSTTFHPATAELLHAVGISLFAGHDVLSPFVNLAFAGLALLAAWSIGSARGAGPTSLTAVAALLVTPLMLQTQPGEAANDLIAVTFLLAACGLLAGGYSRAREAGGHHDARLALTGLAAGLALGTKLSLLAPAVLLCVLVPLTRPAGARLRAAALVALPALAGGGFWYARNLARTGNPLPWYGVSIGPLHLHSPPMPETSRYSFAVAHYATDGHIVRSVFAPALSDNLGQVWWALVALAIAGALAAIAARGDPVRRVLGIVAAGAGIAYLVTPAGAGGPRGDPVLFGLNLRFATPALALGLALAPAAIAPALASAWQRRGASRTRPSRAARRAPHAMAPAVGGAALAALLLVTQSSAGFWPTFRYFPHAQRWWGPALAGGLALAAIAVAAARRRGRATLAVSAIAFTGALVAAGWPAQRSYEHRRYAQPIPTLGAPSLWARRLTGTRIGFVGYLLHYPLYGPDDSNRVDYVGRRGPHGGFAPIATCAAWRAAVDRGRYRYLVVAPRPSVVLAPVTGRIPPPAEFRWTSGAATIVLHDRPSQTTVFRLTAPLDPGGCGQRASTPGRAATVLRRG